YGEWLKENMLHFSELPKPTSVHAIKDQDDLITNQIAFGYTEEELKMILAPMAYGEEAIGSMGTDTPLAVLSDKPQLLFSYFKQLFAQVTNPPIDPIREDLVMSLKTTIGSEQNLFDETPAHCHQLELESPILRDEDLARIQAIKNGSLRTETLSTLYAVRDGAVALEEAIAVLCDDASAVIARGATILVLSDRGVDSERAAIPSLLAVAAVHHHLIREGTRTRVGLVLETAEPREVHHFAVLAGFGAGAINPYLAFQTLKQQIRDGVIQGVEEEEAVQHYIKAIDKGLMKVMSKMGISTLQSYRGAQIFEAIGLSRELVDRYFTWTASRLEGIGIEQIARETGMRHHHAFDVSPSLDGELDPGGNYQWRRRGEYHMY